MKIVTVVGARPQFIKYGPLQRAIAAHNRTHPEGLLEEVLIHSGQHHDQEMSDIFFQELQLKKPDYQFTAQEPNHGAQTGEILKSVEGALLKEKPDMAIVFGDTNTTLASALAAAKLQVPVAHIEAGVRTHDIRTPEEINRRVTDHIAQLLFCVNRNEAKNLADEGIRDGVYVVGDVMYDSLLSNIKIAEGRSEILQSLQLVPREYVLVTAHRAENVDDKNRLQAIFAALNDIAHTGVKVVLPLHPRTKKRLEEFDIQPGPFLLTEPLSYLDMLLLEKNAKVVLTDSGGVQREAYWLGVPCITFMEEAVWPETLTGGWNVLVGTDRGRIVRAVSEARVGSGGHSGFGDGHAAEKIISIVYERTRRP